MINISIPKVRFPNNHPIDAPIEADMYIKPYYGGTFTLIQSNVNVGVDGTVNESPLPVTSIDPTLKYVLRTIVPSCSSIYDQVVSINFFCPVNYTLAEDSSFCYLEEVAPATPPMAGENAIAVTFQDWSMCGSVIYSSFNINGTGTYTPISIANPWWVNGVGNCVTTGNYVDGPMNRMSIWAATPLPNQRIGFAVCIDIPETKTYYLGIGVDNFAEVQLDGNIILSQDADAMSAQFGIPFGGTDRYFNIYPLVIPSGTHALNVIGVNGPQTTLNPAALGVEIYSNTEAEISAATSYADLNLIFSSKDYVGQPIQIGSGNIGYSCPEGYSLSLCSSPIECRRIIKAPVQY